MRFGRRLSARARRASNADNGPPPVCIIGWSWLPRVSAERRGTHSASAARRRESSNFVSAAGRPAPRILLPANNSDGVFWASQLAKCMPRAPAGRERDSCPPCDHPTEHRRPSARGSKYPPLFVLLAVREHIFRFCSLSAFYSQNRDPRRASTFLRAPGKYAFLRDAFLAFSARWRCKK